MEDKDEKTWLFQENIRLQKLANDLEKQKKQLAEERVRLKEEDKLNRSKQKILELELKKLAVEKESLYKQQLELDREKKKLEYGTKQGISNHIKGPGFFGGVTGLNSLKKRYKDLMKIYHPDNRNGDSFTVACINKEYEMRKEEYKP